MRRLLRPLVYLTAGIWALWTFFASNNPEEVKARIGAWGKEAYLNSVLERFVAFAGSSFVLAATFFAIGFFVAIKYFHNRRISAAIPTDDDWPYKLGSEMDHLIWEIGRMEWAGNARDVLAQVNVIAVMANEKQMAFPKQADGFSNVKSLLPYLHQVSAFLKANQLPQARAAAELYSKPAGSLT